MAQFIVEVDHTGQDCTQAVKSIAEQGMHILNHSWFACKGGIHKSWVNVEVDTAEEARMVIPPPMRRLATIIEVERMDIDAIKDSHAP